MTDIFGFSIYLGDNLEHGNLKNTLIPDGDPSCWTGNLGNDFQYVTGWVINNGNLDYLKCYDELNWETQTSCK